MTKAIFKFNGGRGAILCNGCGIIVKTGHNHDLERPYFCASCMKEIEDK